MPPRPVRVLVWDEGSAPRATYPDGLGRAVADGVRGRPGLEVNAVTGPADPDQGTSPAALAEADVLIWWSHHASKTSFTAHAADRIVKAVMNRGMGLIVLHSGYLGKPFQRLLGTGAAPAGGEDDGRPEEVVVLLPDHPITRGVTGFTIPAEERYDEPWDVPEPDAIVLESRFPVTGTRFRSGCCWTRGNGRIFYLRPGHETYPIYYMEAIRRIIANAAGWAGERRG